VKVKKNFITVTVLVLPMLLLVASADLAAEGNKAPSTTAEPTTSEQIPWQVISSGGTRGTSTNYVLTGTVGQTAVGYGSSTNFRLSHGFWQEFGPTTCCNHDGIRGDVNYSLSGPNVADLTYLVAYLKQSPPGFPAPPCFEEGDVNGNGAINVGDVTYLTAYLKQKPPGSPPPPACP
jgi:hypothetical protein